MQSKRMGGRWLTLLLAGFLMMTGGLAGCTGTSPPVQYYTLAALATSEKAAAEKGDAWDSPGMIAVGPVALAQALDRPHMVTQSGENQLIYAETHRWADPLGEAIARVLADNLSILLGSDNFVAYADEDLVTPAHRILIHIHRFNTQSDGSVILDARWSLKTGRGTETPMLHKSTIHQSVEGNGYAGIAAAQSAALADFSSELAVHLRQNTDW